MEVSSSRRCKLLLLLHVVLLAPLLQARPLGRHGAPLMLPSDGVVIDVGGVGRSGGYIPPSPRSPHGPITLAASDDVLLARPGRRPTPPSPWHPGVPTHTQLADDGGVSGRQPAAPPPPDPNTPVGALSDGVSRGGERPAVGPPSPAGNPPDKPKVAVAPPAAGRRMRPLAFLRVIRDAVQHMVGGLGA